MKKSFCLILVFILAIPVFGQPVNINDSIASYFQEVRMNAQTYKKLWNRDLYGPLLLVDQGTRKVYTNTPDSAGYLKQEGSIFTGILPENINLANTSLRWSGKTWAMIMLPLPGNRFDRLDLLCHELFHSSQNALGFQNKNSDNDHLDKREGRVYLRLELEALRQALLSKTNSETNENLSNAIFFRETRYSLFPTASSEENLLELNEGLAAYTGLIMSGRDEAGIKTYLDGKLTEFQNYPTFVRSFAYVTTPIFGYLLAQKEKNWNLQVTDTTDLTEFFIKALKLNVPVELCHECMNQYGFDKIAGEETEREQAKGNKIADYKRIFIEEPHLEIRFENMNISFDPRNPVPLEEFGTVYPTMRVTDNWGILTVKEGALLGKKWDKVTVSDPVQITPEKITGNGWTLELNKSYTIIKNPGDKNFTLKLK
jgi:hypothetical protein